MTDYARLLARLEDEREEAKDCSRVGAAWNPVAAQRIANTMYEAGEAIAALTRELAENDTAWERSRDIITGQYRDAMNALFSLKSEAMEAIERIERVPCADGAADSEAWRRQQDGRGAERMRAIATGLRARLSRADGGTK